MYVNSPTLSPSGYNHPYVVTTTVHQVAVPANGHVPYVTHPQAYVSAFPLLESVIRATQKILQQICSLKKRYFSSLLETGTLSRIVQCILFPVPTAVILKVFASLKEKE